MNESGWQSNATMAKLSTNEYVSLDAIDKLAAPWIASRGTAGSYTGREG